MEIGDFLKKNTLKFLIAGFALGVVASGAGAFFTSVSGSPAFCGSCHSMKEEKATFAASSHRALACTECHLPHQNLAIYMTAKATTGMVDMYHEVLRDYPAKIKLSPDGVKMVNENCLRCHSATMDGVYHSATANRDCLKCHRRIAHGSNHLEGGIKVE
ncbi:MAG: NapC/NirT family cytochrome c [Schwartzia sp.]|nr:NapC/NirT family cytochrome c [Schwartzia sp. (in: firmicutes)]